MQANKPYVDCPYKQILIVDWRTGVRFAAVYHGLQRNELSLQRCVVYWARKIAHAL